jgi:oxygen-independent coproporphyrinogen-3 oxidase
MAKSLYVHIPFCLKRCIYCDFVSGIYDPDRANDYINALKTEISTLQNNEPLDTLFIGGGTPTALSAELMKDMTTHIFSHFDFSKNYEATIEANPGTVDSGKLKSLISSGINRISIGVQSFNNDLLEFLGRIHSSEEAVQAVGMARNAGFKNISIDLIYGIPGQTLKIWQKTLKKAVELHPDHISTYEITYEKDTELYNMFKEENKINPHEEDEIVDMYEYAIDFLKSNGFSHYEISNFAMPGFECRHNLNYWDRGEYYGAGLGAHSFVDGSRYFNISALDRYIRLILDSQSPVDAIEKITADMALSEALFLGLRKTRGISLEVLAKAFGKNILSTYDEAIHDMKKAGLIEIVSSDCSYESILKLTGRGLLLSNEVFVKFL